MRDLTALHTSMTAAHKAANARGKRAQQQQQQQQASTSSAGAVTTSVAGVNNNAAAAVGGSAVAVAAMGVGMNNGVKVEELQMHRSLSSANNYYGQQRPGTSVGYDVGPDSTGPAPSFGHRAAWQLDTTAPTAAGGGGGPPSAGSRPYHAQDQLQLQPGQHQHLQQRMPGGVPTYPAHHPADGHSFRDSHQSFRSSASASSATGAQYQYGQQLQQQQSQQSPPPTHHAAPGQSFLASQSFLPSPAELASGRPSSSRNSRPPTAGGPESAGSVSATQPTRTPLPPLRSVVPQSLAAPGRQPGGSGGAVLHLPPGSAGTGASRPRPGTAPATYAYLPRSSSGRFPTSAASGAGSGLGTVPELSVYGSSSTASSSTELGGPGVAPAGPTHELSLLGQREHARAHTHVYHAPPSPPDGYGSGYYDRYNSASANDSPFSFHPPSLGDTAPASSAAGTSRLRKRPYSGSDSESDDYDDRRSDRSGRFSPAGSYDGDGAEYDVAPPGSSAGAAARPPPTPSTAGGERPLTSSQQQQQQFDYGSGTGSRPQSRRLSVMELCNDSDSTITPGSTFLPLSSGGGGAGGIGSSRPATASGRFEFTSPGAAAALAESDAAAYSATAGVSLKTFPASAITATALSSSAVISGAISGVRRSGSSSPGGGAGSPSGGGGGGGSPFAYGLDSPASAAAGGTTTATGGPGRDGRDGGGLHPAIRRYGAASSSTNILQQQQFQRTPVVASPRSPASSTNSGTTARSRTGSPAYAHVGIGVGDQQREWERERERESPSLRDVRDQVRVSVSPRGSTATPTGVRV